ncbi:hypothetical protein [Actinopolyspora mortivallis]|uniref:Uncharacterized protein n=1 Tax=Actinopolyspora mortivallis TaxID=33906 RepID=A0A2T0GZ66_ACTMO|nr:hypothetical protein [Actinopolyspora mortivallis]PRW64399.1 hypothetical protein CEP50_05615 [Actinopolyspora mortivallis]
MLLIVLLLLLVAAGVLVLAVSVGLAQWAWLTVLLCAVAGFVLLVARRRDRARASGRREGEATERPGSSDGEPGAVVVGQEDDREEGEPVAEPVPDPETEPPEQHTDAADALLVAESGIEVLVIDERPRYHLDSCPWVGRRSTVPLPAHEARELGFTPCSVCRPDHSIAQRERSR